MTKRAVSIKSRIILTLVLFPFISLLIVGSIALYQNQNSLARQAELNLERLVVEKTTGYDHIFQRIQEEAAAIASYAEGAFSGPPPDASLRRLMLLPWTGSGYGSPALRRP